MTRSTFNGFPKRRIAIIQNARPQLARLGGLSDGDVNRADTIGWATVSDAYPDSSDSWLAYLMQGQQYARTTTPGTLQYTPASNTAMPAVAPWNNWIQPNNPPADALSPATAIQGADTSSQFWIGLIGLVAIAALVKGGR